MKLQYIYHLANTARIPKSPQISASVLVRSKAGQFMLLQRAAYKTQPNTWSLPGGNVDKGETPAQAAARETIEETGFTPDQLFPLCVLKRKNGKLRFIFLANTNESFTPVLDKEHIDHKWVNLDNLPNQLHKIIGKSLKKIEKKELFSASMKNEHASKWIQNPQSKATLETKKGTNLYSPCL